MQAKKRFISILILVPMIGILAATAGGAEAGHISAVQAAPGQEAVDVTDAAVWSDLHYRFVAGATLTPRDNNTTWGYGGAGCVYAKAGNAAFVAHLNLPHGSRVDYVRIYYYDTSANNSSSWLTTYNGSGNITDRTSVSSSGSSGYGSGLSPLVNHLVNTAQNAYVINWQANQTGTSMRLCGVRIAYRLPINQVYLPLVRK